ncbi:MAG: hypothetical protein P1P76_12115 [Anaerolineales bacterium]|nr:hypothetical protein [Anaerolineales bacterium]
MENDRPGIFHITIGVLLAAALAACGATGSSQSAAPGSGQPPEEVVEIYQYKLTIGTDFGRSDALKEAGRVVFDGTFSPLPNGVIEPIGGVMTISGAYSCREAGSDPPVILSGTLSGEHEFKLEGSLIDPKDYGDFDIFPLESLVGEKPDRYALISIPKVSDRTPISVSFGRERCTGSQFTPIIAEVVSFGEIPFFSDQSHWFVVPLFSDAAYEQTVELNAEGKGVLSRADLCVAPAGMCP